ncbi:hypothetical protein T11_3436 [Trichinella zimbabwensis]|uniref:Uncharacterized protein n=1 Tax=Trichinella zimbabwensis TaxID=268475 RepID=A0A0V1GCF1_9BILA|nr:hypothetical protein T11_3436 [Trichinella zimbabwensis]
MKCILLREIIDFLEIEHIQVIRYDAQELRFPYAIQGVLRQLSSC